MKVANEFCQPINPIGGTYPINWSGYAFLQPLGGGRKGVHVGIDYNGPGGGNTDLGFDIFSVANGIVEKLISWDGKSVGYGNHLFIRHELSPYLQKKYGIGVIYSHYAHLEAFRCFEGQEVTKGQVIAKLGKSGTELGHLHLETRKPTGRGYNDYPSTQPLDWLRKYYFDPYYFIQDNLKEPEQTPTTENSQPSAESPAETPPQPASDPQTGDSTESGNNTTISDTVVPDDTTGDEDGQLGGVGIPDGSNTSDNISLPVPAQKTVDLYGFLKKLWKSVKKFFLKW